MNKADRFYIGVDGGGTQTRAMLADGDGRVWGEGRSGSANRNHYTRPQILANLQAAIGGAMRGMPKHACLSAIYLGLGGISTEEDRADIVSIVRDLPEICGGVRVTAENDAVVALTGGLAGRAGLALIAGTGSACLGINGRGERGLCGGWGAIADDIGSAPWLSLRAVQMAVRAEDGRRGPTRLHRIVADFLRLSDWRQMIRRLHNEEFSRADLGRLAPAVVDAYAAGDDAAAEIVHEAARGLSELVQTAKVRLFPGEGCEAVLVGGLALSGPPFQPLLIAQMQRDCPDVRVQPAELAPTQGAVLEAMRSDGMAWTQETIAALRESQAASSI